MGWLPAPGELRRLDAPAGGLILEVGVVVRSAQADTPLPVQPSADGQDHRGGVGAEVGAAQFPFDLQRLGYGRSAYEAAALPGQLAQDVQDGFLQQADGVAGLAPGAGEFVLETHRQWFPRTRDLRSPHLPTGAMWGRPRLQQTKLKPRWDVHLSGDDDQLGCAGESLSSVLGERPGSVV